MESDACLICQIDKRGCIVADDMPDRAARFLFDRHRFDPARIVSGSGFLKKARLVDAVRVTFQGQRPAAQMR